MVTKMEYMNRNLDELILGFSGADSEGIRALTGMT